MVVDLASDNEYLDIYYFAINEGKFIKKINNNEKEKIKNKHFGSIPTDYNVIFIKTKINVSYIIFLS